MVTLRKWVDTVLRKRNINRQPLPCSNSSGVIVGRLDFFTTPLYSFVPKVLAPWLVL